MPRIQGVEGDTERRDLVIPSEAGNHRHADHRENRERSHPPVRKVQRLESGLGHLQRDPDPEHVGADDLEYVASLQFIREALNSYDERHSGELFLALDRWAPYYFVGGWHKVCNQRISTMRYGHDVAWFARRVAQQVTQFVNGCAKHLVGDIPVFTNAFTECLPVDDFAVPACEADEQTHEVEF